MSAPTLPRLLSLLCGLALAALSAGVRADPPARVARLAYVAGAVSFSPADDDDWIRATVNRPLVTGDRLWTEPGARDEFEIGNAAIRMSENTSVTLLNLDDQIAQLQLAQGALNVRVRRLHADEVFEIDTPNLALVLREAGDYRIEVDASGEAVTIAVRSGQADVYGEGAAYTVDARQAYRFLDRTLQDYEFLALPPPDEFDRWSAERERRIERSASARYVARGLIGYEDLDEYGSWRTEVGYGTVWTPTNVASSWTPYREGHWAWINPWGWTWVDAAPWGFAVSHYGRWAHLRGRWCWVPGPVAARPVYAPALVAFVGGALTQGARSGHGHVAWFPLGPSEVYRPSYKVSRTYFTNVNTSNTALNQRNLTNIYNTINVTNVTNVTYVNRQVPGALIAVPSTTFAQSQPVARAVTTPPVNLINNAPVTATVPIAPTGKIGAAAPARKPPPEMLARQVVARTPPPVGIPAAPAPTAPGKSPITTGQANKVIEITAPNAERKAAPQVHVVPAVTPVQPARAENPAAPRQHKVPTITIGPRAAPAPATVPPAAPPAVQAPPAAVAPAEPAHTMNRGKGELPRPNPAEPARQAAPVRPPVPTVQQGAPIPPAEPGKPQLVVEPHPAVRPAPPVLSAPPTVPPGAERQVKQPPQPAIEAVPVQPQRPMPPPTSAPMPVPKAPEPAAKVPAPVRAPPPPAPAAPEHSPHGMETRRVPPVQQVPHPEPVGVPRSAPPPPAAAEPPGVARQASPGKPGTPELKRGEKPEEQIR